MEWDVPASEMNFFQCKVVQDLIHAIEEDRPVGLPPEHARHVVDIMCTIPEAIKTKSIVEMLKALGADRKALIVMPEVDNTVVMSARNIPGVKTALVNTLNVYDILNYDKFIVVKDAVAKIEEVYA